VSSPAVHASGSIAVPTTRSPFAPGYVNINARASTHGRWLDGRKPPPCRWLDGRKPPPCFACTPALFMPPSMTSTLSVCMKTRSAAQVPVHPRASPWQRTTTGRMCNKHLFAHGT
jgi:hypothetical protein